MTRIHSKPPPPVRVEPTPRPEAQRPKNEVTRPAPGAVDAFAPASRTAEQLKRLGSVMSLLAPELAPRVASAPAQPSAVGVSKAADAAYDPSRSPAFRGQLKQALGSLARDDARFDTWVRKVFGAVDPARKEALQKRMASGDIQGLLPKAEMVRFDTPGASGAYVPQSGKIYVSADLSPRQAQQVYLEELGHHLQRQLAGGPRAALKDTLGDEGAIFAASFQRDASGNMRVTEQPKVAASVRTENDVGTLRVPGPDGKPMEVKAEFNWFSQVGHAVGGAFHSLVSSVQGIGQDLKDTVVGAGSTLLDSALLASDAIFNPQMLPADLAHLQQDTLKTLGAGWASVKDVIDVDGRLLDWVEHGILSPVLNVVDQRFVEPAGNFLHTWMVDPANSAMGGLMAKALGGDANTWKGRLEGFEGTYADYVKGLAEGAVDVVQGTLDFVLKPGETVENITRLGLLVATDPHKAWDAVSQPYRDAIDSGHPAEAAGRLVANVLGMVLAPEDIVGPVSAATVSAEKLAQAGDVLAESARTIATSMESREAAAAGAVRAAEGVSEADPLLVAERQQHLETYNSMKDGLRATADELDARLESDAALTPDERARLTATRDTLRESANKVEALEVETVREHVDHLSEIEVADDAPAVPAEVALSAAERMKLEVVARTHNILLTPVHGAGAEGITGFLVEEPLRGSVQRLSMTEIRASLERAGFDDFKVWDGRDPAVKDQVLADNVAGDPINGLNRLRGGGSFAEPVWSASAEEMSKEGVLLNAPLNKDVTPASTARLAIPDEPIAAGFEGMDLEVQTYEPTPTTFYQRPASESAARKGYSLEMVPEDKVPPAERSGLEATKGVYLDWKPDAATRMDLGSLPEDVNFFSTAQLNGCGLIIGGTPEAPVIMHANAMDKFESVNTAETPITVGAGGHPRIDTGPQDAARAGIYQKVGDSAVAANLMPGEPPPLVFGPNDYNAFESGAGLDKVNVYGVKNEAGEWTLYYSGTRQVPGSAPQKFTRELWPNKDLTPLQEGPPAPAPTTSGWSGFWETARQKLAGVWGKKDEGTGGGGAGGGDIGVGG